MSRADEGARSTPLPEARVTLPLGDYDRLLRQSERPGVTVVDTLRVGGTFKARDLWLHLSGRSSGRLPQVPVLLSPTAIRIHGCEGEGILLRGREGSFDLQPEAPRFSLRCRLALTGSDRLQLDATPAVLWVESQVGDGEMVASDDASGRRSVSIVRVRGAPAEWVRSTATARYLISLLPEETRFRYQIEVNNANRSHQPFVVELSSGEHVQRVDARVSYEVDGARYRFTLPPGEQVLVLSGSLKENRLIPPIDASVHYLLIESHPLLRPQLALQLRRISAAETGLSAQFRGAQGFLLGDRQPLAWTVTRLEALRTTSFAVHSVRHVFFLSADARALGETHLLLHNQGAPDLTLPMRAEPTFASLEAEPALLTRNEAGHLWLPLSQGSQRVLVQHRQGLMSALGLASATLWLPQLPTPASTATIELRYSREWVPLFSELAPEGIRPDPDLYDDLFVLLLLALWTERLLAALGVGRPRRLLIAAAISAAALWMPPMMIFLLSANVIVSAVWVWPLLHRVRWSFARVLGALLVIGLLGLAGGVGLLFRGARFELAPREALEASASRGAMQEEDARTASLRAGEGSGAGAPGAPPPEEVPGYQGLPAKFEMPAGARSTVYHREMFATESPRAVRALLISHQAILWLGMLMSLLALATLLLIRDVLASGWRRLREQGRTTSSG